MQVDNIPDYGGIYRLNESSLDCLGEKVPSTPSNNRNTVANNNHLKSVHLSDFSQLTSNNDTTLSFSENDLLLEPVSFDGYDDDVDDDKIDNDNKNNNNNNNNNNKNIPNYDISALNSNMNGKLTLNDIDNNTDLDCVYDYLSSINVDDNNLSFDDFNLDLQLNLDSSLACPNIDSGSYLNPHSNLNTPSSKILNNIDIPFDDLKRSFTRLKQTSELINTERVYIFSLKILERVYLNNFISDTATPIYFEIFRNCVIRLLKNHQYFYDNLVKIYEKWFKESIKLLNIDNINRKDDVLNYRSPDFNNFNYVSNEKEYLESIVKLIVNDSIDVETYSTYCSLFQKVLKFSGDNNIEKYKRDSIVILNDYFIEYENLKNEFLIDKHLDTRFISVVQMPTNRMTRYKLILKSLLKNIELDEKNSIQLNYYNKSLEKINFKIDDINNFMGNEDSKLKKLMMFKNLILEKRNYKNLPNDLFLENLENLQLASSFGLIYINNSKNSFQYEYVCGFLFKSHLILAQCSNIIPNSIEIKFIIPLISISNNFDSSNFKLLSNYDEIINLNFEDNFNIYEIGLIFPNEKEKLIWKGALKIKLDQLDVNFVNNNDNNNDNYNDNNNDINNTLFLYSDIQSNILSIDISPETKKFNVSSFIPSSIKPFKKLIKNKIKKEDEIHFFDVIHFTIENLPKKISKSDSIKSISNIELNESHDNCSIISNKTNKNMTDNNSSHNLSPNKIQIIRITLQERVAAQTCINLIWSNQFDLYSLDTSMTRSLSNMFSYSKLSLLSLNTPTTPSNNSFIPPSPSFVNNNSSGLGSPIRLRNSKSVRTLRDVVIRTPTAVNNSIDISGDTLNSNLNFNQEVANDLSLNKNKYIKNNTITHSSSVRSISSLFSIGNHNNNNNNDIEQSFEGIQEESSNKGHGVGRLWRSIKTTAKKTKH